MDKNIEIFRNASGVRASDGTYCPLRFTESALTALGNLSPMYERFGRCSAGVVMSFVTDAPVISFTLETSGFYTRCTGLDFYEDGIFLENRVLPEEPATLEIEYKRQTSGRGRMDIYLPANAQSVVSNLQLGNFDPVPETESPEVIFYGDSLTQCAYFPSPSLSFTSILAREYDMRVLNRGVGSLYYDASALDETEHFTPKMVFVEFGGNDLVLRVNKEVVFDENGHARYHEESDLDGLIQKASEYLEKLRAMYPKARIVPLSLVWCTDRYEESHRILCEKYKSRQEALFSEMGLPFIDGNALLPRLAEFRVSDGSHFSKLGSYAVAATLSKYLR